MAQEFTPPAPKEADESRRTLLTITELTAAASAAAFISGIVYDQAFLTSLDPHLPNMLSVHDSIVSGMHSSHK